MYVTYNVSIQLGKTNRHIKTKTVYFATPITVVTIK